MTQQTICPQCGTDIYDDDGTIWCQNCGTLDWPLPADRTNDDKDADE
jgi:uncharacterized Zn finger protein (UPF0148 family)